MYMCTVYWKRYFYWNSGRYWLLHFNCFDRDYYAVVWLIKNLFSIWNRYTVILYPIFYFILFALLMKYIFLQILGILCMSLASPAYLSGTHFFLFVATTTFIGTLVWIFVYLLSIREALNLPINWILTVSKK